ncbi:hypothetical protein JG688_00009747 [Phytophthora aleatoria]|uniref:Uncharacterized protein n=1 Tax=Phytophthora aleatoria TaxID=2496075 RepID=A0A8J5J322_9STRA|nr:hypothetical protein JG688_00009747 [Phytophthora aleatoria]
MNRIYEFAATREEAIKDAVVADDIDQLEKLLTTASSLEIDLALKLGAVHNNLDAMEAAYSIVEDPTEVVLDAFDIAAEHDNALMIAYENQNQEMLEIMVSQFPDQVLEWANQSEYGAITAWASETIAYYTD